MEHLYPTRNSQVSSENNNNKLELSSKSLTLNDSISNKNLNDSCHENEKQKISSVREMAGTSIHTPSVIQSSAREKDQLSSFRDSSLLRHTPVPIVIDHLQSSKSHITQTKSMAMEIEESKSNSLERVASQNIMDIEARIQRERARILGSYHPLNTTSRLREDQVLHSKFWYLQIFVFEIILLYLVPLIINISFT